MKKNLSFIIYILIVLSSLTFYNPFGVISSTLGKFLFYISCTLGLIIAIKKGVNLRNSHYPKTIYKMIIYGILISTFMATIYQQQSFATTLIATLPYFLGYLVFFILMKLDIPKEQIRKALWIFCFIGMTTYLINLVSIPNLIFGEGRDEFDSSRGFIRLSISSLELIVLFLLYSINQWIVTKKKKYLCLIALTATFIILSVVRQYIMISALLSLLLILNNSSITKKIFILVICFIFFTVILPKIPMYQKMSEVTKEQVERNNSQEEDIRIQAWKFYTYEYQTNFLTAIFGNGTPSIGNSIWGNHFEQKTSREQGGNGCFYVDVGWAGFYWLFGIISTISLFILLIKGVLIYRPNNELYLKYWCLFLILSSIASAPILFYKQIVSISTVLYLIYGRNKKDRSNYPQL